MKPVFSSVLTCLGGRWVLRLALVLGVLVLLAYVPYRLSRGEAADKLASMESELHRVEGEIAKRKEEVSRRLIRVRSLKSDPRAVEDMARDRLQMVYPNEITLRLRQHEEPDGRGGQP